MRLLWLDAKRVVEYHRLEHFLGDDIGSRAQLMRVYESLIKRAGTKREFPRLYRWAWIVLTKAIENADWNLLLTINHVYHRMGLPVENLPESGQFSEWHLKSVLYCWLYLPEEGPLQGSGIRRSEEGVERLISLVSRSRAYLNLLPKEAERKLIAERVNTHSSSFQKPYLFRLSTNEPGIITMSFRTPISDHLVHKRIHNESEIELWLENRETSLYRTLFYIVVDQKLVENAGNPILVNSDELLRLMREPMIDYYLTATQQTYIKQKLQKRLGEKQVLLHRECFSLLYQLFYCKFTELQLEPENQAEQLGLTENYLHSYTENSTNRNSCLSCYKETSIGEIREAISGRTYCSSYCYGVSFSLSY